MSEYAAAYGQPDGGRPVQPAGRMLSASAGGAKWAAILLWVVDGALLGVLFLAPYFMGGRHPLGQLVFVILTVVMAIAWSARQCLLPSRRWVSSVAEWILLAAVLLCLVQFIPWSSSIVAGASPQVPEILTSEAAAASPHITTWSRFSLTPTATLGSFVMCLSYGLFFLVLVQRIESIRDVQRILRWIAGAAVLMAVVGLAQYLAGNGKFMWVYEHPFRKIDKYVLGSFINRNHFTHFLALGIGPLLWWTSSTLSKRTSSGKKGFAGKERKTSLEVAPAAVLVIALGCVLFAGLMSLSRGGALAMGIAVLVGGIFLVKSSLLQFKHLAWGVLVVGMLAGALFIHGQDKVGGRLDDLVAGSLDELDGKQTRRLLWWANLEAFQDFPLLGTGLGSHRDFYTMYLEQWFPLEFTHAENGYLQIASEAGIVGLTLMLIVMALVGYWSFRLFFRRDEDDRRSRSKSTSTATLACCGAVTAGLMASLAHSFVDFVWYIPACMSVTLLLVACLLRMFQFSRQQATGTDPSSTMSRSMAVVSLLVVTLAGCWMISNRVGPAIAAPHWDRYLRVSAAGAKADQRQAIDVEANADEVFVGRTDAMIGHLQDVLRFDPSNARAHVRLAGLYLRRFEHQQLASENAMSLSQIGNAAIASKFSSRQALVEWLDRAIGPNRKNLDRSLWHVRCGLALGPLQGEGYLYLADLCFLDGGNRDTKATLVAQALQVRPHNENVLFAAGKNAMLSTDWDAAIVYWRKCYHQGGRYKTQLASLLSRDVPVEFFLKVFEPDLPDWEYLYDQFRATSTPEQIDRFCDYFVAATERDIERYRGKEVGRRWIILRELHAKAGRREEALKYSRKAIETLPTDRQVRLALGEDLVKLEQFAEAEDHLRWCVQREPENPQVKRLLEQATIGRVRNAKQSNNVPNREARG